MERGIYRWLLCGLFFLLGLSVSEDAAARRLEPFLAYFNCGLTFPASRNVNDTLKRGPHFGGGLGVKLGGSYELMCDFEHHILVTDGSKSEGQNVSISRVEARLRAIGFRGKSGSFRFLSGGAGIATLTVMGQSKSYFSTSLGAGLEYPLKMGTHVFIQLSYVTTVSHEKPIIVVPLTVGLRL